LSEFDLIYDIICRTALYNQVTLCRLSESDNLGEMVIEITM